jgi:hypothetical protein
MGCLVTACIFKSGTDNLKEQLLPQGFFEFKIKNIEGKLIDFKTYKNRKLIMVMNVACK